MTTLSGKTLFISGASRGIGLEIALRAARDGASVIVAAKTAEPHPKLPGTIYTAAEQIEAAGGRALPLVVDIREEEQVRGAVAAGVKAFGGIDILVNNASAISLTNTLSTPIKRFDLMHQINTRGTYLCSQVCIPHLKKAGNPHILNLAPPLQSTLQAKWFAPHVAYTMAKYGMTLCAFGMAEEFRKDGIGVNTLWPKTVIQTVAVTNMPGGDNIAARGRLPQIMADAAHAILVRDSRTCTGNFFIDEDVLREQGVTDFGPYRADPDLPESELFPDFFL